MTSEPNAIDVKVELTKRGISQQTVAKELGFSNAAVSRALKGQLPTVLRDIRRYLASLTRNAAQ